MNEIIAEPTLVVEPPDISHIVTEDDEPVDNIYSAKQQRLLVETLYTSWQPGRPFVADANVGIFSAVHQPPRVPDMFLSLDVTIAEDWYAKKNRSYFMWEFGKPPDVVVEIVSNKKGGEADRKLDDYAQMRIAYYAIYDPLQLIQSDDLKVYELYVSQYVPQDDNFLQKIGLELVFWEGVYETKEGVWLRWRDANGVLLPTGAEAAQAAQEQAKQAQEQTAQAQEQAKQERERAEQAEQVADEMQLRAERLAAQLRALGVEPKE
ncbi:MAG: Uma2 family endonuclease [Chloroflexi bacterium]|nr:Uma2 family endonuclease [Chloroflexota bacterium]